MSEGETWQQEQFGVLCDRQQFGLGLWLMGTGPTIASTEAQAADRCRLWDEHPHLIVRRTVTYTGWSDPIAGETAPVVAQACTCASIDGYRIRSHGCPVHNECLDSVGPIPKLDGDTYVCVKPKGHDMPHESPNGAWWEPPTPAPTHDRAVARGSEA